MFQRLAQDAVPNDGDWNSEKCLEEYLALNSISRFLDSCCVSIWVIALLEKGLKPWQMGISLKEKCQQRFLSKLIFGIIVFLHDKKTGTSDFMFKKKTSALFVEIVTSTTPKPTSMFGAPRSSSAFCSASLAWTQATSWQIKKLTPGMKRWKSKMLQKKHLYDTLFSKREDDFCIFCLTHQVMSWLWQAHGS